jgi:hypothetical protein
MNSLKHLSQSGAAANVGGSMTQEQQHLLDQMIAKRAEIGTKQLAEELGISQSTVRVFCTGNYSINASPQHILQLFSTKYINVITCTFTQELLNRKDCREKYNAPSPAGGYSKTQQWLCCQTCVHKGE